MPKRPRQLSEFAQQLRDWRGKRYQKEAADALGVPFRTYVSWEQGQAAPAKICQGCVESIMLEKKQ